VSGSCGSSHQRSAATDPRPPEAPGSSATRQRYTEPAPTVHCKGGEATPSLPSLQGGAHRRGCGLWRLLRGPRRPGCVRRPPKRCWRPSSLRPRPLLVVQAHGHH